MKFDNLNKVIVPIAGLGTRMLPATKAIPKEMLPIVNKPIIQYIVEEIIEAGFKEIIFITHSSKSSVENHFDQSFELETTLKKKVKRKLLKEIKSISNLKISIHTIRQGHALGLGHAIACAKPIVQKEPFAVVLPDMLIKESNKRNNLFSLKKAYEDSGKSQILVLVSTGRTLLSVRPNSWSSTPLPLGTSKSDRVSPREGSHRGLTATVFLHPNALLPVHPGGGTQGAFPP